MTAWFWLSLYLAAGACVALTFKLNIGALLDLITKLRRLTTDDEREHFDNNFQVGAHGVGQLGPVVTVFLWPFILLSVGAMWWKVRSLERRVPVAGGYRSLSEIRQARMEECFGQVEDVFATGHTVEEKQLLNRFFEDTASIFRVVDGVVDDVKVLDERLEVVRTDLGGETIYEGVWEVQGLVTSMALRLERSVFICTGSEQDVHSYITLVLNVADAKDASRGAGEASGESATRIVKRDVEPAPEGYSQIASYMYEGCDFDDKPHWHGHLSELFDADDPKVPEVVHDIFEDFFEKKLGAALRGPGRHANAEQKGPERGPSA